MSRIASGTHSLQVKFQKVCRQIENLLKAGKAFSFQKITELVKRRDRYARRLLMQPSTALKAGSVVLLASALSLTSQAQSTTYVRADSANPVRRAGLPQNLQQPTFVDIDGDGDLDCFETQLIRHPGPYPLAYPYSVQVTFLRNKGTKTSPKFVVDSTSFPTKLDSKIYNAGDLVTRLQFADIDGDGDYDLFAGSQFSEHYSGLKTQLLYYKNVGTAKKAKFVKAEKENPLSFFEGYYDIQFSIADFDKDGDYDVVITDLYAQNFYKNTGTSKKPQFAFNLNFGNFGYFLGPGPIACVYDYNKDGKADLFNADTFLKPGKVTPYRNESTPEADKFKFVKDNASAPKMPSDFFTFEYIDINNDGVAEAYTDDGQYAVALKTTTVADKQAVSVTTVTNAVSVKAYPNPFTGSFVVNLGSNASPNTAIRIADLQGRIISTVKANSSTVQLGSNLQKGIYFIQVIQDTKVIFTQKVIKE